MQSTGGFCYNDSGCADFREPRPSRGFCPEPRRQGGNTSNNFTPCTHCMGDDRTTSLARHLTVGTTAQVRQVQQRR